MDCTPVTRCRCCGGDRLTPALDLGEQPLANAFHRGGDQPRYPLEMLVCLDCCHGQLSVVVPGEAMFTDYPYLSSGSGAFWRHCRELVWTALGLVDEPRPAVLDVGCNDGTLLSLFKAAGCDVLGVDPAANLGPHADRRGVPVVHAFWGGAGAARLGRKFDVITAQNVLAHVPDPGDFLAACHACLAPGGVVLVEFPYSLDLIDRNEFDTIYHEHLSYFLVHSFFCLLAQSPLYIAGVTRLSVHGGSLRFALRARPGVTCPAVADLIRAERDRGMYSMAAYRDFRGRVEANRREFRGLVAALRARGEKVVGYCASAKGVTAMNYFDVRLDYIVDDTELKQGLLTAGLNVPVVRPEVLRDDPAPLNIVVLAWNWLDEIKARVRSLRGGRDSLISYVPGVSRSPCKEEAA